MQKHMRAKPAFVVGGFEHKVTVAVISIVLQHLFALMIAGSAQLHSNRRVYVNKETLGPHNAVWDDGEWIEWRSINSHLERLEYEAQYPNADVSLVPILEELVDVAQHYHITTGKHLNVYGDIGELYGAITYGIELHKDYAKGSDGRLGNDFVEVKTITPFKNTHSVTVRLDRHFSKLLVVKVDADFEISGQLVERKKLPKVSGNVLHIHWDDLEEAQ